jgi:hypothetical protein
MTSPPPPALPPPSHLRLPPPTTAPPSSSSTYSSPASSYAEPQRAGSVSSSGAVPSSGAVQSPTNSTTLPPIILPTRFGPLAQPISLPPLPKAGRKPLTTPPKDNRQRQNREAQRTYRRNQREEMQALRDKESGWTRTAREGRALLEDVFRAADTLPPELRQRLFIPALGRFYDDLEKFADSGKEKAN